MNCDKKTINLTESALKTPVALVISLLHLLEAIKQGFISSSVVRPQRLFRRGISSVLNGSSVYFLVWVQLQQMTVSLELQLKSCPVLSNVL